LADMGRLFNDEDEAKMEKLTEDLTAWINKYASTFDDPESVLFEVASSLVIEDTQEMPAAEPTAEPTEPATVIESGFSISFSFGDNNDWFSFEQTLISDDTLIIDFDFDFNNVWAEITKGLNGKEDWDRLNSNDWDNLIQY